jgi:hypothetical protein
MKNNIVFITNLSTDYDTIDYSTYALKTWNYWCKKNSVELVMLETPLIDTSLMKATWQRWYALDILQGNDIEFDQVALIDIDTMIKWDAPNFFEETGHQFSACIDNDNVGWVIDSINGYQKFWPDTNLDWTEYFNCGFIVLNKRHESICQNIVNFWKSNSNELTHMQQTLRKGTDQTPVNYITKSNTKVNLLNKKWNLTHLNRKEILNGLKFIDAGYIWHFNGFDKHLRANIMQATWNQIKTNYEN